MRGSDFGGKVTLTGVIWRQESASNRHFHVNLRSLASTGVGTVTQ